MELMVMTDGSLRDASGKSYAPDQFPNAKSVDANALGASGRPRWQDFALGSLAPSTDNATRLGRLEEYQSIFQSPKPRAGVYNTGAAQTDTRGQGTTFGSLGRSFQSGGAEALASIGTMFNEDWDDVAKSVRQVHAVDDTFLNNSVRGLGSFAPMAAAGLATGGLGAMAVGALQAGGGARGEIRDARLAGQDVSTWDAAAAIGGNMVLGAGEAALQMAIMKGFSPVSGRLTQQITGRGITNAVTRAALPMMAPGAAKTVGRVAGRYVAPGLAQFGGAALLDQASEQVSNVGSNLLAQNFYDPGRGAFDGAYETFEQSWLPSAFSAGAGRVNAVNRHSMDRRQRTLRGEAEIGERKSETMSRERRLANGLRVEDAVIVSPEKKTEAHKVAEAMAYNATGRAPAYYTSSSPRQAVIINEGTKAKPKLRMYINAADPDTTAIHEAVHGVSGGLESEATARLEQLQAQADIAGQGTELYMARVQSAISFTSENLERLKASTPVDEKGRRVKEYSIPRMEADLAALIKVGQRIASNPNIASEEGVAVAAESSFGPAERQSLLDNTPGAVKRMWDRVRSLTAEGADRVENERIQRQIDLILEPIARNTIEARKQMRTEIETLTARRTAREDSGISGQFASEGQIGRELVPTTNPPAPFDTSGIPTPEPAGKFRSPESDDSIYREINRTIAEQEAEISRTDIDLTQQAAEQRAQDMDADTGYRAMRQDALADQGYQQSKQNPQPTDAQLRAARMATAEYDRNQRMRQDAMARAEAEEYARGERSEMDRMQEDVDSVKLLIQQDTIGRRQAEADAAIASEQEVLADQGYRAMRQDAAADQGLRAAGQDRAADTGYERAMIGNTQAMLAERMNRGRLPRPQAQMNPEMLADATQDVVARQRAAKMEPPPVQAPAPTVQPPQVDTLEDNGRRFSSDNAVESWLTDLHRQYKDSGGTARKALGMLRLQYDERVGDQYKPSLEEEAAKGDKAAKVALKWAKQSGLYWTPIYPRVNQGGDVVGMQGSSAQQPAQNVQNQDQQAQPQQQQIADAVRPEGGDDQKYTKQARGATTKKLIETLQWINERPISEYKPADAADLAARKRVIEEELKRRNDGGGTPKAVKQGRKRTGKAVPVNIDEMTTAELRKVAGKYGIEADEMTPRGKILDGLRTVEQAKGKPFTDRDVKFSIAGEKSISNLPDEEYQTARYNLKTANAMEREGLDNEKIRMATGWFKQPDGKWRYEIDDSGMKITLPWFEKPSDLLDWTREMPLSGLIEHPSLFEAYPRLDRLNVYFRETHNPAADISAKYDGNITLYISSKREASVRELRSSLLHEIQHAIQEIEGFSRGASPSEFLGGKGKPTKMTETARKMIEGGQVEPDKVQSLRRKIDEAEAINAYQNVLGEREARNVEARIDMTPEQRRATPPDYGDGADVKFSIRADGEAVRYSIDGKGARDEQEKQSKGLKYVNITPNEIDELRRLEPVLKRQLEGFGIRTDFQWVLDDSRGVPLPDGWDAEGMEAVAGAFGKKVVPFIANDRVNGFAVPGIEKVIAVNASSPTAHLVIAGHEIGEKMLMEAPALHAELVRTLSEMGGQRFTDAVNAKVRLKYLPEQAAGEVANDTIGDRFAEPEFWNEIARQNPTRWTAIRNKVVSWLTNAMKYLRGRGFGTSSIYKDMARVRQVVAKATNAYAKMDKAAGRGESRFSISANEAPARIESADDLRAAFYAGPGDRIEQLRGVLYDDGTFAVADASGFQHTDINRYWGENKREVSRFFLQQDRTGDVMAYFPDGTKSVANHPAMKRMGFRVDDETMATVSSPDRGAKFSIRSDDPDAMRGVSENMGRGRTSPTNAPQRPGSGNKAYQQGRQAFEYYGRADLGKKARAAQNAKLREAGLDPLDPSVQQAFRQGIQDAENERTAGRDAQRQSDVDAMDPWGSAYRDSFGSEWLDMTPRRRREIIESDIEAHNTERAADEYKQLTIEQRFARGIETHIDRQDAITDALERSGIPLVDTSGDSKYFRIGDAKIRISNHDPKPTHERQFGAATIDINTSDDRRAMATHHTGGMTFEQIADLVRQLRKSFNPSAPAAPGGTPRFSIASTAGIPEGKLDDPKHIATATAAWKEKGTESPWFKRWFKDSKVVDGEGKPMVVYHGTAADFTTFDSSLAGRNFGKDEPWHFFSSDPEDASLYARHAAITTSGRAWKDGAKRGGNAEDGSAVVAAYVSLRNPLVIEGNTGGMGAHYFVENKDGALPKIISALKSGKYDGVITRASDVKTPGGVLDQIVIAKLPEQIKSVNNRGTFDDANPDVRFSVRAGEATAPENIKDTANNAIRRAASGVANLYDKLPEGTRKAIARQFTQAFQQTPAIAAVNEAYEQESLKTESDREAIIRIATKPARTEADLDAADRILRGHPLDIDDVTPELLAAAKMGRDEWRQKAQELSREMQALGLTARDEWMNAERYWYPNIWSKHNVRSVMGRLYAVATGGRKLTASEAGHQKARTTDRFTVVNSKTGKIMPGGIFASRADAEAFMAAAGGEKPHYIKYRFRDNDGKMKDALETFSTIHEARRAINSHMEDGLIRNDDDIKIMDFGKKPPLRIMEPMTVEQQRAHGLVEDVATNFRLGVASAQSLVAKVRFFNNLYGAVKDTDIFRTSADLEVNPSNEYVRVKDLGLKLPDKIDNANIRALMDGAVRRDLADDLAGMFGERNGLFWKLSEFGKELDRISGFRKWVTYRNPFRYVKQFPENEIMMYIADAKAFADVKTRATAIVEFVNWARSKQTDSPFMQEFAESGLLKTDFLHGPEIAEAMHLLNKRDGDPIARHDLAFKGIAAIADKAFGKGNVEAADNFAKTVYGLQDAMYKYQLYNAYRSRGVDAAAAQENVRKYMFDWDHAPRLVKSLQFIPFAPSVLWQFSRIFGNKMKADPAGFSMKLGLTIGGLAMLRSALMGAFGVDEEDREKMAWYEFPLPMTDSNGRTMTIDSRWMVPFQDVARFVPGDAREFRALWRSALPMTAQPVATLATQQTRFGRPIIYDNEEGKAGSVMAEAMLDAAPGLLGQYWRAQYRNATRDDKYGQDWWVAAFTRPAGGISARPNPVSIPEAYKDAASPVRREKSPERPEFARWAAAIDREKDVAAKLTMQEEFVEAIKADALPARWRVENEMAELAAKSTAYNAARQSLQDRRTDRTEAMEAIKKNRLSAAQSARLARLRAIDRQVSSIEKRVKSGVLTADAAKRQIDRLLRSA